MKNFYYVVLGAVLSLSMMACSSDDLSNSEDSVGVVNVAYSDVNEAYDALLNAFSVDTRGLSSSYPEYYGGAYVEKNKLVLLTPSEFLGTDNYKKILGNTLYEVRECEYSYNDLVSIKDIILDYVVSKNDLVRWNIQSCGISDKCNRVVVYLYDAGVNAIESFKSNVIDSPAIEFKKAGGVIVEAKYPMNPGTEIQVPSGSGSGGSMGYRAKYTKNGVTTYGFVTCAHVVGAGEVVRYAGSDVGVSDASRWLHSGIDATFCTFESDRYEMSNTIGSTGKVLSVTVGSAAVNSPVFKYGRTTIESDGVVEDNSTFYSAGGDNFTDVVRVKNMDAARGDSGGIVYDSSNKTLGIVSAIEENNGQPTGVVWYIKASNINSKFGISRY